MHQYVWLFRSRPLRLVLLARCISYAGHQAALVAATVYVYRVGGAGLVGVLAVSRTLSGAFLVPLVTSWSYRMPQERLLLASVLPRAVMLGAAGAVMTGRGQAGLVIVLVALESALSYLFGPVQAALLPWLARTPAELTSANAAGSMVDSAALLGGPVVAAALLAVSTLQVAVLASAGLVAAGAALLAGVRPLATPLPARHAGRLKQLGLDLRAGVAGSIRTPGWLLVVPASVQMFVRGALNVLTVVIALDLFRLGSAGVGWLGAALGVGGIVGGPVAVAAVRGRRVARCFAVSVASYGAPLLVIALAHARYWPYLLFAVIGLAGLGNDVASYSALQRLIPGRLIGPALGGRQLVALLSLALGSAVAPALIRAWGARPTLVAAGLLLIVTAAAFAPGLAAIDRTLAAPGPEVALLRGVPFFGPLSFATVEHLAGELGQATYADGEVVIREGEAGDLFYIIASGRARVCQQGKPLRELAAGDWFGEIALLRPIPRTATVAADGALAVRSLARAEFLAAVTGNPESAQSAQTYVTGRLRGD